MRKDSTVKKVKPQVSKLTSADIGVFASHAMLACFTQTKFTANRKDSAVTSDVISANNADKDAGQFNKKLLRTCKEVLAAEKVINSAYSAFKDATFPWMSDGRRMVPCASHAKLSALILDFQIKLQSELAKLAEVNSMGMTVYELAIEADKPRLGNMFSYDDYPSLGEFVSRYSLDMEITPMPSTADFRISLAQEEAKLLTEKNTQAMVMAMTQTVECLYSMVASTLSHLKSVISSPTPDKSIKTPLIKNARLDMEQVLNANQCINDARLAKLASDVLALISGDDATIAETLRESEADRQTLLSGALAIEQAMSDVF